VSSTLEACVDRSFRLRGRLLVVAAALLGAVIGVAFGLMGERGDSGVAVAAPRSASRVAPATTPASSQPPASRAAGSAGQVDSNDPPSNRRAESVDRPGKGQNKPGKHERDRDKPGGHGKGTPGKGNDK
jgi:hypothetical protein